MNIANLFKPDYWFSQPFIARDATLWLLIGGFLFFILAGLVCKILAQYQNYKPTQTVLKKFSSLGVTMGFLGLVWMFFRQERVAFLAWRFWMFMWVAGFAFWAYRLIKYLTKRIPELKTEAAKRAEIEKYLP